MTKDPELVEKAWINLKSAHDDLDACKEKLERAELQLEQMIPDVKSGGSDA